MNKSLILIKNKARTILPKMSLLNVLGIFVLLFAWWLVGFFNLISQHILPTPGKTYSAFIDMLTNPIEKFRLGPQVLFSLKINLYGYFLAILTALPIGFILGMNKTSKAMFEPFINSLRFIPITALGGIFVALSGLTIWTKINFLAFGIWVYLVPVVVQRISEVSVTHLQMMKTLGASKWQTFKFVIFRYVSSRLIDDIRILVGISWTYIIVAELKNIQGGVGSLIYLGERQDKIGQVYAIILVIVFIGVIQDLIFKLLDRLIFKFKYS